MLRKVLAIAAVLIVGIIAGCGGGCGSAPAATVSGIVADGYLVGAEVFMDKNGNYQWDAGEPKTITGAGGAYSMTVSAADAAKYPVMARVIAGTTVDEDTNVPAASGYVMSAPPGAAGFISPMSTLIREKMAANPGMTVVEAMTQLRNQMNLPVGINMMADYVADSQPGSSNMAQSVPDNACHRPADGRFDGRTSALGHEQQRRREHEPLPQHDGHDQQQHAQYHRQCRERPRDGQFIHDLNANPDAHDYPEYADWLRFHELLGDVPQHDQPQHLLELYRQSLADGNNDGERQHDAEIALLS
ncbi:MAG: hypothetical protein WA140_00085 [Geobacteraceae bacterium]